MPYLSASAVVIHYTKRHYIKCMDLYLYLYAYTLWHRTTIFGVVTHMGEACFRGSATPLHLYKCVARFVSNS